jgi:hypothetical protein
MANKMRFTEEMIKQVPSLREIGYYYNIDSSVGMGAPNKRDDVLLIQFMLNIWARSPLSIFNQPDYGELKQDGAFGLTTQAVLVLYQYHRSGFIYRVTGRVEPITSQQVGPSTLTVLNMEIWQYQPVVYKDFASARGFPQELRQALK